MEQEDTMSYDTLDELAAHVEGITTVQEFFQVAFGLVEASDHAGFIVSGHTWRPLLAGGAWGSGRRFASTIVYLRSYPPGRFGRPLQPGEVRITATCAASVKTGAKIVTVAKIYLIDGLMQRTLLSDALHSKRESVGPVALHLLPLLVYQDHFWNASSGVALRSARGHRVITPSTTTIVDEKGGKKVLASFSDFHIASGMLGLHSDNALRRPVEVTSDAEWTRTTSRHTATIMNAVRARNCQDPNFVAGDIISGARVVCEDMSAAGLVDLIGSPVLLGALPDALTRPDSVLCVIAAAARIAAHPERMSLSPGSLNDSWAAAEVAGCFEACYSPVVRSSGCDMMAIDLCINSAINNVTARASGEASVHFATAEFLFRAGCALCIDVCGPVDEEQPYTRFGMSKCADEVASAHVAAAQAAGLGKLFSSVASTRSISRADRQTTLLRILDAVEVYLRTGDQEATCAQTAARDADGFAVVISGEDAVSGKPTGIHMTAVNTVQAVLERLLSRGPSVLEGEQVSVHVVSNRASLPCANCSVDLGVLEAGLFPPSTTHCSVCLRPYCHACGEEHNAPTCLVCSSNCARDV